ncbi:MAG: hypothetical protein ACXADF_16355 [Candidatus Thorarchaeota archaeon]
MVRQITNEEHVSITFAEKSRSEFDARLGAMLAVLRDHMLQHNQQVVLAMKSQIEGLIAQTEAKAKELDDLQKQIDKKSKKLHAV